MTIKDIDGDRINVGLDGSYTFVTCIQNSGIDEGTVLLDSDQVRQLRDELTRLLGDGVQPGRVPLDPGES